VVRAPTLVVDPLNHVLSNIVIGLTSNIAHLTINFAAHSVRLCKLSQQQLTVRADASVWSGANADRRDVNRVYWSRGAKLKRA
jgi:hypothetical protein